MSSVKDSILYRSQRMSLISLLEALVLDSKYYPSPLVQGGLEIKVRVSCYWTESGIHELKGMIEGRYSFANRMRDDSQSILLEITALMV